MSALSETRAQRSATIVAAHQTGFGGSDAGTIMGLNPRCTSQRLFGEHVGVFEREDISNDPRVKFGLMLEGVVADSYAEETGRRIARVNETLRHPQYPHMVAHLDRRIIGERRGLECKTTDYRVAQFSDAWGEAGSDHVPPTAYAQCQHYMAVTGWDVFDVAVLIGGNEFRIYTLTRNEKFIALLIEEEAKLWRLVQRARAFRAKGLPIPDDCWPPAVNVDDVVSRWPFPQPCAIEATPEICAAVDALADLKRDDAEREARRDELELLVKSYMADNDTLVYGGQVLATFKATKPRATFDAKRHAAERAECHTLYAGAGKPSRQFLLKEPK